MVTAEMPAKNKETKLTTLKARKRVAEKVGQLASLTGVSIPDVLDRYEAAIDEDLLRELARRKAEIEQPRRGKE